MWKVIAVKNGHGGFNISSFAKELEKTLNDLHDQGYDPFVVKIHDAEAVSGSFYATIVAKKS